MKKVICLVLTAILLSFSFAGCKKKEILFEDIDFSLVSDIEKVTVTEEKTDYVMIDVENYGKIVIRLFPDVAPETVENFKKLVSDKFYDGLIFHRVIKNFMIQTGDPLGNGTGGSSENIKGEFSANGFTNNLKHVRGVVSMARRSDSMDSASSQFFICQVDYPSLNGQYASFGFVVYGMDVVDAIAEVRTNSSDKPRTDIVMNSIRFVNVPADAIGE